MTEPRIPAHKGEILVVDDNPANLTLLSTMLTDDGYEVRAALSGALALRAALASAPDLVLLDVNMPGLNGYDVCRRLKEAESTRGIPIIFISALDAIADKVMAFTVGGADYVTKPFQMREILARVETQLTLARLRRDLAARQRELDERHRQLRELNAALRGYLSGRSPEPAAPGAAPARGVFSILASEIQGFVRLAEHASPAELLADLDVYSTTLTAVVAEHGGDVERLLGDTMVAFFPSPPRALRAACHIQKALAALNRERVAAGGTAFGTRIGVATGPALLSRSGPAGRSEITLIGECVGLAARLQGDARPGGVLLDDTTFQGAGRPHDLRHIVMRVRGQIDLVKAHEILPDVALRLHETFTTSPAA